MTLSLLDDSCTARLHYAHSVKITCATHFDIHFPLHVGTQATIEASRVLVSYFIFFSFMVQKPRQITMIHITHENTSTYENL